MFCFICNEQYIKTKSSRKQCGLIPNKTIPTFQEVDGVIESHNIAWMGILTSPGIAFIITKLTDFYSQCFFSLLFATVFNCNEQERKLIAKFSLPM